MKNCANKTLALQYFKELEDGSGKWRCACGVVIKQPTSKGYTNLINHIKKLHPAYTSDAINTALVNGEEHSSRAINLYGWLNWVCSSLKPVSFVQEELTLRYSNLRPVSLKVFIQYLRLVTQEVERIINEKLPDKFAIALDGWYDSSSYYIGIFALYINDLNEVENPMLSFSLLTNKEQFSTEEHMKLVLHVLNLYNKDLDNVVAIIGEVCEVNTCLSTQFQKPLIGCYSQRVSLAIGELLAQYDTHLSNINTVMQKLRSKEMAEKLKKCTILSPISHNVTDWFSSYVMLKRYQELCPILLANFTNELPLLDYLFSQENTILDSLIEKLKNLNSVSIALHREDIDLSMGRNLLDGALQRYPELDPGDRYLSSKASIIKHPEFESGVCKIINQNEEEISYDEANACCNLLLKVQESQLEEDLASEILAKCRKRHKSSYINCRFITPTSKFIERLFKKSGQETMEFARTNTFQLIDIEEQLFLNANKNLWSKKTVEKLYHVYGSFNEM